MVELARRAVVGGRGRTLASAACARVLIDRHADLIGELAAELGVEPRALRAVLRVESAGEGLVEGRPIVRLEVHHLWSAVPRALRSTVDAHYHAGGPRPWEGHEWRLTPASPWLALHQPGVEGQRQEWAALALARSIDESAAICSTSWGCGQVLGTHWLGLGYSSPTAFAQAQDGEPAQLRALAGVLRLVGAVRALAARDWRSVARAYNGPGQVEWYVGRLAEAYARG